MKPFDLDIAIENWVRQLRKKTGFEDVDVQKMYQEAFFKNPGNSLRLAACQLFIKPKPQ